MKPSLNSKSEIRNPKLPRRFCRRAGVSLIEMLIALSITAVLLIAVAAAFDGSLKNYKQNEQLVDALQGSRVLMHRIMTQARQSTFLSVTSSGQRIQVETTSDNYQYIYVYVPTTKQVLLSRMNLTTLATESLGAVDNVTTFSIPSAQWVTNPPRLTLSMTVSVGGNDAAVSASAVPRQTISF